MSRKPSVTQNPSNVPWLLKADTHQVVLVDFSVNKFAIQGVQLSALKPATVEVAGAQEADNGA